MWKVGGMWPERERDRERGVRMGRQEMVGKDWWVGRETKAGRGIGRKSGRRGKCRQNTVRESRSHWR